MFEQTVLRKRLYYPGDVLNASDLDTYYTAYPANNYINKTAISPETKECYYKDVENRYNIRKKSYKTN